MRFIRRFLYRQPGEMFNVLMWPFLLQTLVTGVAFIAFGWTNSVKASILYTITTVHFGIFLTSVWGILAVVAIILTLINLYYRYQPAGSVSGTLGIMLWMYALILYLLTGYYYQAVLTIVPLYFWIWHSVRITRYYNTFGRRSSKEE